MSRRLKLLQVLRGEQVEVPLIEADDLGSLRRHHRDHGPGAAAGPTPNGTCVSLHGR